MSRVQWRGVTLNKRSAQMMDEVQAHVKFRIRPSQGSYNRGGVAASGGTHDGGGAIDVSVRGLTHRQIVQLVKWMRTVGWAAWYRPALPGVWGAHCHGIAIGTRDLAPLARSQVIAYKKGLSGLKGGAKDIHAGLGIKPTTFEAYLRAKQAAAAKPKTYTVRSGDTTGKIAARHGLSVTELVALNPKALKDPDVIHPGDVLRVSK